MTTRSVAPVPVALCNTVPDPPSVLSGIDVPPELEAILMRCLEKSPDARFLTAHDLTRALSHCAQSVPWSLDYAEELWGTLQTQQEDGPASAVGSHSTLAIDVGDRVES